MKANLVFKHFKKCCNKIIQSDLIDKAIFKHHRLQITEPLWAEDNIAGLFHYRLFRDLHTECFITIYPEDVGFRAFYGDPQNTPEKGIEVELGNLAGIVSTIASLQVQEAVKVLTGLGRPLRNRLLFIDSLNGVSETISLK